MRSSEFAGQRVTVMGIGLFGGGVGVARFLAQQGARVTATDLKGAAALAPSLARLDGLPIVYHLGGHVDADFTDTDLVVVNPAVADDSPFLAKARQAGVPLETEINLFFKRCPARIVGVTGSNGKSTAATLAAHLLAAGPRRVWLGGNIGRSLLEELDAIHPDDLVVLELSSFQLERLEATGLSPAVSIVLNCTPNHLDRHGTFANYARAKQAILRNQRAGDAALLNADCSCVSAWGGVGAGAKFFFSIQRPAVRRTADAPPSQGGGRGRVGRLPESRGPTLSLLSPWKGEGWRGAWMEGGVARWRDGAASHVLFRRGELVLRGDHNVGNALAAAGAAVLCGVPVEAIGPRLAQFRGLEHRLEFVRTLGGASYYNDSKATTPEAAIAGVRAFDEPVVLIAGGYDKQLPFRRFALAIVQHARAVVLLGATAGKIQNLVAQRGGTPTHIVPSLADAVRTARDLARPGDAVLLSPACASYDMFENYEQRGEMFKKLVMEL